MKGIAGVAAAVLSVAGAASHASPPQSIWDGVYTDAQAARGQITYGEPCGRCHGERLNGAPDDPDFLPTPPVGGAKFLRNWDGRTLAALVEYTRTTMPAMNPGYLSAAEVVDIVAWMLAASGVPAGAAELSTDPDRLARIVLSPAP